MKEIKLKALVGDEIYFMKYDKEVDKGKVFSILIGKSGEVTYTTEHLLVGHKVPLYREHTIVGTSKEDLIEELTKLINECKL